MKILYVVPYLPDLIRSRPYNLLQSLSKRGNEITLIAISNGKEDPTNIQKLYQFCQHVYLFNMPAWRSLLNCALALPTRKPLQSVFSWNPQMARLVMDFIRGNGEKPSFDVVHVEHLRGIHYALKVNKNKYHIPVIWDSVDSISYLFRQAAKQHPRKLARLLLGVEVKRTEGYESWLPGQFNRVLVTSPIDRQAFLDLNPANTSPDSISVISQGTDIDYFKADPGLLRKEDTLVITGKMSYHANVKMVLRLAQNILPLIWAERPEVNVWVVGQNPPEEVQALAADSRIRVTGWVPDLRPYLQEAAIAVAPVAYGAGIQNKVLEAMACETPVVTSPRALFALNAKVGEEVAVGESDQDFAREVLRLLSDSNLRRAMGLAGRKFVEREHSWDAIAARLERIYSEEIHKNSGQNR